MDSEEKIRDAFRAVWRAATNQPQQPGARSLMQVPCNQDEDADFVMHRALDELFELRKKNITTPAGVGGVW